MVKVEEVREEKGEDGRREEHMYININSKPNHISKCKNKSQ